MTDQRIFNVKKLLLLIGCICVGARVAAQSQPTASRGIGMATAHRPEGPFKDHGKLFRSNEIQIQNCIDPFYIEDKGKKYLFWGSFHGIYGTELTADGLSLKKGAKIQRIAGEAMMNDRHEVLIHKNEAFVGTGHNSKMRLLFLPLLLNNNYI